MIHTNHDFVPILAKSAAQFADVAVAVPHTEHLYCQAHNRELDCDHIIEALAGLFPGFGRVAAPGIRQERA
ncbi:MAG: hypothetical protein ABI132_05050 [Rhodanobacteraceae bacterium]